jgi:Rod binding domain-containing protein
MASDGAAAGILNPVTAMVGKTQSSNDPSRIKKAASQFEALLIGQLLKSAREAGSGGWMGDGDDQTGSPMMEMAESQLASLMASQGGFGLAKMVVDGLARKS